MSGEGEERVVELARREADVDRREADVARREADVAAREAALAERLQDAEAILEAADDRDAQADLRDAAADKREEELDRARMLSGDDAYGYDWPERRNAGMDRLYSKGDREASHDDRIRLTEGPSKDETEQS